MNLLSVVSLVVVMVILCIVVVGYTRRVAATTIFDRHLQAFGDKERMVLIINRMALSNPNHYELLKDATDLAEDVLFVMEVKDADLVREGIYHPQIAVRWNFLYKHLQSAVRKTM